MTSIDGAAPFPVKRLLIQLATGGLFGFLGAMAVFGVLGAQKGFVDSGEAAFALAVGTIYLVTGLGILMGIMVPRPGAVVLNVEDREELHEVRPKLTYAAIVFVAVGAIILLLACAPIAVPAWGLAIYLGIGGLLSAVMIVMSIASMRHVDELDRSLSRETSSAFVAVLFVLLLGWAFANAAGMAFMPGPTTLVAGSAGLYLIVTFIVIGRKGMLRPRG